MTTVGVPGYVTYCAPRCAKTCSNVANQVLDSGDEAQPSPQRAPIDAETSDPVNCACCVQIGWICSQATVMSAGLIPVWVSNCTCQGIANSRLSTFVIGRFGITNLNCDF